MPVALFVGGQSIFLSLGALLCIFINPDLDQDGLSYAETMFTKLTRFDLGKKPLGLFVSRFCRGVGITLMGLWIATWGMYSAMIKHRSPLSHWPILGTAIRVAYILIPVWWLTGFNPLAQGDWLLYMLAGLALADAGHYLRDIGLLIFREETK